MKRTKRNCLILALLFSGPFRLCAQDPAWTLDDCLRYAWKHSPRLRLQQLDIARSEEQIRSIRRQFAPILSLSGSGQMSWGRSVDLNDLQIIESRLAGTASIGVSASFGLFEGFDRLHSLRSGKTALRIARIRTEQARDALSLEITRAFLQAVLSQELLRISRENLACIRRQHLHTSRLVETGRQTPDSLLELDARLASEQLQVTEAEGRYRADLIRLKSLLPLEPEEPFDIRGEMLPDTVPEPAFSRESLIVRQETLPAVRAAELTAAQRRHELARARGRRLPTLSLTAGYGSFVSSSREASAIVQLDENRNPSLGFSLQIPILARGTASAAIREARLDLAEAEISSGISRRQARQEISLALLEAQTGYRMLREACCNESAFREAFRHAEERFNLGKLDGSGYLIARNNLQRAVSEKLQYKYRYWLQLKILDYYRGIPLAQPQ